MFYSYIHDFTKIGLIDYINVSIFDTFVIYWVILVILGLKTF